MIKPYLVLLFGWGGWIVVRGSMQDPKAGLSIAARRKKKHPGLVNSLPPSTASPDSESLLYRARRGSFDLKGRAEAGYLSAGAPCPWPHIWRSGLDMYLGSSWGTFTADSKTLEQECRMIYPGNPSFFAVGLERSGM